MLRRYSEVLLAVVSTILGMIAISYLPTTSTMSPAQPQARPPVAILHQSTEEEEQLRLDFFTRNRN